jgi:bacterioferritin-associated ferredoxin
MSTPEQNMAIASGAEGEDDFEHYFNATHRLSAEVEQLRAQVAELATDCGQCLAARQILESCGITAATRHAT